MRRRKLMAKIDEQIQLATNKDYTPTISIPKTKVIKQPIHQPSKPAANDTVQTAIKPTTPQKALPNQQIS